MHYNCVVSRAKRDKEVYMAKDYGKEVKQLKNELDEIKKGFKELDAFMKNFKELNDIKRSVSELAGIKKNFDELAETMKDFDELAGIKKNENEPAAVKKAPPSEADSGEQYSESMYGEAEANVYYKLIENKTAGQLLQTIGSNDRLLLLLAIIRTPMNVATMVSKCNFNSTGQAYHHLKPLVAAGLVSESESERGIYEVSKGRAQGVYKLLSGVAELIG